MRERKNIQPLVDLLTKRVISPDEDDWGKLNRGMKYLKGTFQIKFNLTADTLNIIHWWVDVSYGVHWDCKGHTGAIMSMVARGILSVS